MKAANISIITIKMIESLILLCNLNLERVRTVLKDIIYIVWQFLIQETAFYVCVLTNCTQVYILYLYDKYSMVVKVWKLY